MEQKLSLDTSFKIFDINASRPSLGFQEDDLKEKESLGILPSDFVERDSLFSFNQLEISSNRESLGILQISNLMDRESLNTSFTLLNTFQDSLKPVENFRRKSSASSINSVNFDQIEFPSKIFKCSVQDLTGFNVNDDILNETINDSKDLFRKFKQTETLPLNPLMNNAQIVSSLKEVQADLSLPENLLVGNGNKHGYEGKKFRKFSVDIYQQDIPLDENDDDVFLNTSVMVEANYLASKIADGSIYNDTCKDTGMLDDTPQPDWEDNSADSSTNNNNNAEKNIKDIVFKNVDKFIPLLPNQPLKIKSSSSNTNEHKALIATEPIILLNDQKIENNNFKDKINDSSPKEKNLSQNEQKDTNRKHRNSTRMESKEILQNLSQISVLLNTSRKSDSRKNEAQQLINNLTDLLTNSSDSGNMEDSSQSEEVFQALDLSSTSKTKIQPIKSNLQALDLSVKSEKLNNNLPLNKKISRSFSVGTSHPISSESKGHKSINYVKNTSNSLKSNQASSSTSGIYDSSNNYSGNASNKDSSNQLIQSNKSKPMKSKSTSNIKKGPLKALHPVVENKGDKTPKKEQNRTSYLQPRRTSTPIKEPNICPMAQSTPTIKNKSRSKESCISPVTATMKSKFSINKPKTETTASKVPKFSYNRHNSVTEGIGKSSTEKKKKEEKNVGGNPVRARSNSLGKENRIFSALSKVRQNILASPYYKSSTKNAENLKEKRGIPVLTENNSNKK